MVFALSRRGWPVPGGLPIDVCRKIRLLASNVAYKWCRFAAGVMQRVWRHAAGAPTEDRDDRDDDDVGHDRDDEDDRDEDDHDDRGRP